MAYLGTKPANQVIDSTLIADGTVTTADIADGAITNAKIASMAASKLTGQLPDANAPSGSVIQVVSTTKTDVFTTTSTSWVDITGLSVNITPSSASSRILVFVNLQIDNASTGQGIYFRLVRNSTPIAIGDSSGSRSSATNMSQAVTGGRVITPMNANWFDSPATTSPTTYKLQTACLDIGTMVVNRSPSDTDQASYARTVSTITVMEIAA